MGSTEPVFSESPTQGRNTGTHWDQPNASLEAKFIHLPFFLSVEKTMLVLHTHKLRPPTLFGNELHHRELVGPHAAGPYIAYFAAFHQIMQGLHCLLNWHGLIKSMYLIEIDVVSLKPLQRSVHGVEDALPRQTALIDVVNGLFYVLEGKDLRFVAFPSRTAAFGAYDEFVSRNVILLNGSADQTLGITVAVHIGGIYTASTMLEEARLKF